MVGLVCGPRIRTLACTQPIDLESWPDLDVGALALSKRNDYFSRKEAIRLYISGASQQQVKQQCGIGLKQVKRLIVERCLQPHPDGRIYGFRGLEKHARIKPYVRKNPVKVDSFGYGSVGAMENLLLAQPDFRRRFDAEILKQPSDEKLGLAKRPRQALWAWFLRELRKLGFETRREWPFNVDRQGYSAVKRYSDQLLKAHPIQAARQIGGPDLTRKLKSGDGVERPVDRALQRVEMDAHKLDGRFCVLIPQPDGGWSPKIIHRLWVIVIIDVVSRVVLGYHLSLRREVSKEDVLRAITCALIKWRRPETSFCDQPYIDGAGLPSSVDERFVGLCWDETSVDGALAETCKTVVDQLKTVVGSQVLEPRNSFSVRRSKDDRPFVETFFRLLGERGFQRMTNTTGANPKEKRGRDPGSIAIASEFQYEYAAELLAVLIANYNATPHTSLGYRSPLAMLDFQVSRRSSVLRIAEPSYVANMLAYRKLCTVNGGFAQGRAPFVNFAGARYGGESLSNRHDLVGQQVWVINHLVDDARVVNCSTTDGHVIGVLRASPPWHRTPHSLAIRRAIQSLERNRRFVLSNGGDAIATFIEYVEGQPNKKLPVHPAYLEVRRVLAEQANLDEGATTAAKARQKLTEAPAQVDSLSTHQRKRSPASPSLVEGKTKVLPPKRLAANR